MMGKTNANVYLVLGAFALCLSGCTMANKVPQIPGITVGPVTAAIALIGRKDNVNGSVVMTQTAPDQEVLITGIVSNLPPGKHGFHIQPTGDMTPGCYVSSEVSEHYNPFHMEHGAPTSKIRQVGDLGNIFADDNGVAEFNFTDSGISLFPTTAAFVIGRMLVVHTTYDDMGRGDSPLSKINGNAGGRLACGVIAYQ